MSICDITMLNYIFVLCENIMGAYLQVHVSFFIIVCFIKCSYTQWKCNKM